MSNSHSSAVKRHQTNKKPFRTRPASGSRFCQAPHSGQKCPECGKGNLDYNGLLELCCPVCGYAASNGSFT